MDHKISTNKKYIEDPLTGLTPIKNNYQSPIYSQVEPNNNNQNASNRPMNLDNNGEYTNPSPPAYDYVIPKKIPNEYVRPNKNQIKSHHKSQIFEFS